MGWVAKKKEAKNKLIEQEEPETEDVSIPSRQSSSNRIIPFSQEAKEGLYDSLTRQPISSNLWETLALIVEQQQEILTILKEA